MRIADEWISDVARCATAREWVGAMASVRFVGFRMRGYRLVDTKISSFGYETTHTGAKTCKRTEEPKEDKFKYKVKQVIDRLYEY